MYTHNARRCLSIKLQICGVRLYVFLVLKDVFIRQFSNVYQKLSNVIGHSMFRNLSYEM